MNKPLRVLIIEDSEDDALFLLRELRRGGYEPAFERVESPEAMRSALMEEQWDLIVSDYVLPKFSGLAALAVIKESGLDLPFIIVSGNIGEDIAVGAMRAGAHDYILKGNLKRLVPAVERELREAGVRRDRRRAEEKIRQASAYNRSLIEASLDPLVTIDAGGKITDANAAAEKITGHSRENLIGTDFSDYFTESDKARAGYQQVFREGKVQDYSLEIRHRNGRTTPVLYNASVYRNDTGEVVGIFAAARDITAIREAENRILTSNKVLMEAQRIASLGNWDWDLLRNELHWSDEVYHIFGLDPRQFERTYVAFLNYIHPDDRERVKEAINEALYERKPYSIEHRIVLEDGTLKVVHEQGEVTYANEEPVRMVGTVQDITERKIQEEKLRNSREQLRNLSAHLHSVREQERKVIAREIHDELGQTLTALKMDVSWLRNKYKDQVTIAEKTTSMLGLIDSTIRTVKRISADLRPVVLDDLGLVAAIEWQAEEFQKRTGIKCAVRFHPNDIHLDRALSIAVFRIYQEALTNVMRHAEATSVNASLEDRNDKITLRVKDNGKGITDEEISKPRSFGLMGIRERALYFGGHVDIHGTPDKGTSITITIPHDKDAPVQERNGP